jgi:hypothetical protein
MVTTVTHSEPRNSVSAIELQSLPGEGNGGTNFEGGKQPGVLDIHDDVTPPETAVNALPIWNSPRINMWRVFATYFSFLIFGANDGAYGVSCTKTLCIRYPHINLGIGTSSICMTLYRNHLLAACLMSGTVGRVL